MMIFPMAGRCAADWQRVCPVCSEFAEFCAEFAQTASAKGNAAGFPASHQSPFGRRRCQEPARPRCRHQKQNPGNKFMRQSRLPRLTMNAELKFSPIVFSRRICRWGRRSDGPLASRHSGACVARTSGAHLRIGESRDSGSGPADHPGMTVLIGGGGSPASILLTKS